MLTQTQLGDQSSVCRDLTWGQKGHKFTPDQTKNMDGDLCLGNKSRYGPTNKNGVDW